ncbi:hypothetical protein CsSME_00053575 [Camellia sinensis var. sinensis]
MANNLIVLLPMLVFAIARETLFLLLFFFIGDASVIIWL